MQGPFLPSPRASAVRKQTADDFALYKVGICSYNTKRTAINLGLRGGGCLKRDPAIHFPIWLKLRLAKDFYVEAIVLDPTASL